MTQFKGVATYSPVRPLGDQVLRGVEGRGFQDSHWGEIVQGPVEHGGHTITGIITLPRRDRFATAKLQLLQRGELSVKPRSKHKSRLAARTVMDRAGFAAAGGDLVVASNILGNGGGGSSTSDIIASIRAACDATGFTMAANEMQQLCWEVEGASDPLALMDDGRVVVYASRHGKVIRFLERDLPPMVCLGFVSAPDNVILTDSLIGKEGYTTDDVQRFAVVMAMAERGIADGRVDLVAEAATQSARLNQCRVVTRQLDDLVKLAIEAGALGLSVSHSGVTAAVIFEPQTSELRLRLQRLGRNLEMLGCSEIESFTVNLSDSY